MERALSSEHGVTREPSAELVVREAAVADVDAIAAVHVDAWRVAYRGQIPDAFLDALDTSERARAWLQWVRDPSKVVLVGSRGAAIVGFCALLQSRDSDAPPHAGELAALYVDPTCWRTGCGRQLLEAAMRFASRREFQELTLWVLETNTTARAFYEACGFHADGATKTDPRGGFSLFEVRYSRPLQARARETP